MRKRRRPARNIADQVAQGLLAIGTSALGRVLANVRRRHRSVDLRSGDCVCGFSCGSRSFGYAHSPSVFIVK